MGTYHVPREGKGREGRAGPMRRTRTGLPNWAFGLGLVAFVGGAYAYTMTSVRGHNKGGAKEELEQAIRKELLDKQQNNNK